MGLVLRSEFVDRFDVGGCSVKVASAVGWPDVEGSETPLTIWGWDDASMVAIKIHRDLKIIKLHFKKKISSFIPSNLVEENIKTDWMQRSLKTKCKINFKNIKISKAS